MAVQDKIRGSLMGGAVGDALGYVVEFLSEKEIFREYGEGGIQEYSLDSIGKKALISDDTQMTLFTALAMIFRADRQKNRGISGNPRVYANLTYQDWFVTQELTYQEAVKTVIKDYPDYPDGFISTPVKNVPELFYRRAPGITCLSALRWSQSTMRLLLCARTSGCCATAKAIPCATCSSTEMLPSVATPSHPSTETMPWP